MAKPIAGLKPAKRREYYGLFYFDPFSVRRDVVIIQLKPVIITPSSLTKALDQFGLFDQRKIAISWACFKAGRR
jgi:hypothetical protein